MSKIVRGPNGPHLRDNDGKNTAISFTTKEVDVWVSNKAVRNICVSVLMMIAMATGTAVSLGKGLSKAPAEFFGGWFLRNSIEPYQIDSNLNATWYSVALPKKGICDAETTE